MEVILVNGGLTLPIQLPAETQVGHIRTLRRELEEIGAPSSFSFAVNTIGVEDDAALTEGAQVTFRPKSGEKGGGPAGAPEPEKEQAADPAEAGDAAPAEQEAAAE